MVPFSPAVPHTAFVSEYGSVVVVVGGSVVVVEMLSAKVKSMR
jgi:hypothetical protein